MFKMQHEIEFESEIIIAGSYISLRGKFGEPITRLV